MIVDCRVSLLPVLPHSGLAATQSQAERIRTADVRAAWPPRTEAFRPTDTFRAAQPSVRPEPVEGRLDPSARFRRAARARLFRLETGHARPEDLTSLALVQARRTLRERLPKGLCHPEHPVPQPDDDWNRGIRRPYGTLVTPARIDAMMAESPQVTAKATPFAATRLFVPADGKPHPGILLLHGSEGAASGFNEAEAVYWAKKGFCVLAYAYFGAAGTPTGIGDIPLDGAEAAARWLHDAPEVGGKAMAIYGISRGAEMAVLLASLIKDDAIVRCVIAHSPQDKTVGSFTVEKNGDFDYVRDADGNPVPSWMYRGRPIADDTPIAIEQYRGPLMVSEGLADEVWPAQGAIDLEQRRNHANSGDDFEFLPGEGHVLSDQAQAQMDRKYERFLRASLGE